MLASLIFKVMGPLDTSLMPSASVVKGSEVRIVVCGAKKQEAEK